MKMIKLRKDWDEILKKAWSVRFAVLAALFSGAEVIVPLFADAFPRNVFATLSFISVAGALLARVAVQSNLSGESKDGN